MTTEAAREAFDQCVEVFKKEYQRERIHTGSFGNKMLVSLENDGPVTFVLDSNK